jgi:hydroxymethylpyrimidine pyrophosphatase-like HAD family hydrolase
MKFGVLALDYDGTIAQDGVLDPEVKTAIAEARAGGIAVVLVTGRILSDLKRLAGDLRFVDAVVAENGAVLAFPNGQSRLVGQPPPAAFREQLRRRGIGFAAGQCVLETDAIWAREVLDVIREMELPLVLLFNRQRLMVLPQAISKSTGLREALNTLRLSPHNAIAIGDAENDHDLLTACEIGVAVSWGSPVLQASADQILSGEGPGALAGYIRQAMRLTRLPGERIGRHRLQLGTTADGRPLSLAIRGRNTLIAGAPRSGKSWVTGLACEQLILQGYCVCVIDPEGDYRTLESLPRVVVFGGDDPPPELTVLARTLRHPDVSVIIDLSHIAYQEKVDYLNSLLPMLASHRRATGLPHQIVIDEAHYFLHKPNVRDLLDLDLNAYMLVTYHLSDLHPDVRKTIDTTIVKRTTDPHEVRALLAMAGGKDEETDWNATFGELPMEEAVLLPGSEEAGGNFRRFKLLPRLTSHVRHKAKYLDVQLIREQGFLFTEHGKPVAGPARTLKEFVTFLTTVSSSVLDGHARGGDFSRWIADVFHDHSLASEIRKVEQRHRLGHVHDLPESLGKLIQERYELSPHRVMQTTIERITREFDAAEPQDVLVAGDRHEAGREDPGGRWPPGRKSENEKSA